MITVGDILDSGSHVGFVGFLTGVEEQFCCYHVHKTTQMYTISRKDLLAKLQGTHFNREVNSIIQDILVTRLYSKWQLKCKICQETNHLYM